MNNASENEFKSIWNLVYASMKESGELANEALTLWFSDTSLRELTPDKAVFTVGTDFKYNTVVSRYADTLTRHLRAVIGYEPEVEIVLASSIGDDGDKNHDTDPVPNQATAQTVNNGESPFKSTMGTGEEKLTYNPDYTFDNFVVGGSNSLAHAVAKNVAENPAGEYNPFFLYGPSGVGKTHLMYAITNKAMELYPKLNIVFVKGEEFANQLIESLSHKYGGKTFRDRYRTVDMLLIDDVHFIAGRETVQEEFFHTFNSLFESNKQIIVSSDRPPKDMNTLESRLLTRFESGLMADVQSPDFDLRVAIFRRKADKLNIKLDTESEEYIAREIGSSVRQIEGIIKKIHAFYLLNGHTPGLETIKGLMEDYLRDKEAPKVTVEKVVDIAATHFGVTVEDIMGQKRDKNIRLARNAAMFIVRKLTSMSLPEIGRAFNRNYSTVINNCKAAETIAEADPYFASELAEIEKESKA